MKKIIDFWNRPIVTMGEKVMAFLILIGIGIPILYIYQLLFWFIDPDDIIDNLKDFFDEIINRFRKD